MAEPDLAERLSQYAEAAGEDAMAVVPTDDLRAAANRLRGLPVEWPQFYVDDRVRHIGGGEGVVTKIDSMGVHVNYGKNTGIYDKAWFTMWPNALQKI